jgi:hypothetical protein
MAAGMDSGAVLQWNDAWRVADRWACRLALILEGLTIAWMSGAAMASQAAAEVDRLVAVLAVTAASAVIAFAIHGRGLLGAGANDIEA